MDYQCPEDTYLIVSSCKSCRRICPGQDKQWEACQEKCPEYFRRMMKTSTAVPNVEVPDAGIHWELILAICFVVSILLMLIPLIYLIKTRKLQHLINRLNCGRKENAIATDAEAADDSVAHPLTSYDTTQDTPRDPTDARTAFIAQTTEEGRPQDPTFPSPTVFGTQVLRDDVPSKFAPT